jgi:hypothetical protein
LGDITDNDPLQVQRIMKLQSACRKKRGGKKCQRLFLRSEHQHKHWRDSLEFLLEIAGKVQEENGLSIISQVYTKYCMIRSYDIEKAHSFVAISGEGKI